MAEPVWSVNLVHTRFIEAANTAHRLPSARVQGYYNAWPQMARDVWENEAGEKVWRFPATPAAIDRFVETTRWLRWLTEEQRHLIWMRARYVPWREVCARLGCDRSTAWRRWLSALDLVAVHLNDPSLGSAKASQSAAEHRSVAQRAVVERSRP